MSLQRPLVVLLIATLMAIPLAAAAGGGTVSNKLPTVETFGNGGVTARAVGDAEELSGTVKDSNKEADILSIRVLRGGAEFSVRTILAGDLSATSEPSYAGGWKVWNTGGADGILSFKFTSTYSAAGSFAWTVQVKDEGAYQSGGATVSVTVTERINVAANPFNAAGAEQVGASWGGWSALPGAINVGAASYIKITNSGTSATQAFNVDFSVDKFLGMTTNTESISIDGTPGNVQFAWWEDTSPGTSSPEEAGSSYTFTTSNTGSFQGSFTGTGNIVYVKYRILAIPDPLVDQDYQAAFTATAA